MAISIKQVQYQGQNIFVADIVAAADGDTGEVLFNHGIAGTANDSVTLANASVILAPLVATITPSIACSLAANPGFSITTLNATQVGVTKGLGGVGSAGATPGTTYIGRLVVMRPVGVMR